MLFKYLFSTGETRLYDNFFEMKEITENFCNYTTIILLNIIQRAYAQSSFIVQTD